MLKSYINYRTKNNSLFKCKPDFDIVLALFTLCLMWISYYGVMNISWYKGSDIVSILLFVILTNICLAVAFPIWWIKNHKKQPLSELGLTKKYLILSIAISLILAFWRGIDLIPAMQNLDLSIWLPVMLSSALIFWEPFFVFGWLQTRYENSFGIIPAIFLSALSFILYQIGSAPIEGLENLFFIYIILATAFSITRNIFVLWPIYWCIGSTVNQLTLGMHHDWDEVIVFLVALIIQIGLIYYLLKKTNKI